MMIFSNAFLYQYLFDLYLVYMNDDMLITFLYLKKTFNGGWAKKGLQ